MNPAILDGNDHCGIGLLYDSKNSVGAIRPPDIVFPYGHPSVPIHDSRAKGLHFCS
jgi:hypothetical protein